MGETRPRREGLNYSYPLFSPPKPHPSIQIENSVNQFPGGCGRAVGLSPVLCCF